ncbi:MULTISPECIES: site-specific DNA-methyltransferase [Enterobacteriaceae]|uniref:site-specific DNA-methyltransferase n=1 Tax=Enterobacteriaceae TaxID=543 RepID=UPI001D0E2BD0|nr:MULTISPECIES: site-specific DNA-methyltransferase [Enterobacteriaceae]MDK1988847.1 site-specific DNA-methyltransferase [Klebsiella sp. K6-123-1]MDK9985811.1 site-specific DNA-methyltransferase [Enterobacter asburiae]MDK9995044.1 site-specific DNA-methyltransferase [Enterobacter asburiae]MDM7426577.1 site-specific DNA-methyltransferase [Klebsiella pneumoniae]
MDMQKETLFSEVETANSKQLAVLKANFPQCFDKNGAFIQEKLLEIVKSSDVELSKESYSLNWLGKSYARLLANLPPKTLLTEDKDHNQLEENKNSQNLLIKGDNLEVLKHMVNAYAEKVKMIYIDPPYNTGSDGFVYNDDRKFTPEQLSELAGIGLDEATRILEFTTKGSSSHSAWLTFIYPRLYVAKELMCDEGVICISIDENEHSQLKILCDEVFGEHNFITDFVWKNKKGGGNDSVHVAIEHEYILMYSKNKSSLERLFETYKPEYLSRYNQEDNESKYYWDTFKRKSGKQYYPITCPDGTVLEYDDNGNKISWLRSRNRFESDLEKGDVRLIQKEDGGWSVQFKQRLPKGKKPRSILINETLLDKSGTTSDGSSDLLDLFDFHPFDNPKPLKLLSDLINIVVSDGDYVLDFFGGSGSTAHAILELNKNDNAYRKFILVQIDEKLKNDDFAYDKGYKTIFDITKDRIIKAGEKIKKANPDYNGDIGFKIFETVNDFRAKNESELTLSNLSFFDDVVLTPEQYDTLLTTWCVYDGSLLTTPIEDVDLDGYKAHLCDGRLYMIAPNFTSEALKALLQKLDSDKDFDPNKVVFYGSNFESAKQMELNEALKSYANKKSIDLDLVVRN